MIIEVGVYQAVVGEHGTSLNGGQKQMGSKEGVSMELKDENWWVRA